MTEESDQQDMHSELGKLYDTLQADTPAEEVKETPKELPKEESAATEPPATPEKAKEDKPTTETPQGDKAPTAQAAEPPQSWSAAAKAEFSKLPAIIQQEVLKREQDVENGFAKGREERELGQSMERVIAPYTALLNADKVPPVQAVGEALDAYYQLRTGTPEDKANVLRVIAQRYGVDLTSFASTEASDPVDPRLAAVQQSQETILKKINAQEEKENLSIIENFAAQPENVHFKDVANDILDLLPAVQARNPGTPRHEILKMCYEKAIFANPTVRQKVLDSQRKQDDERRLVEQKEAANKAQKAAGTQLSTKASPQGGKQTFENVTDFMSDAYDRINGTA